MATISGKWFGEHGELSTLPDIFGVRTMNMLETFHETIPCFAVFARTSGTFERLEGSRSSAGVVPALDLGLDDLLNDYSCIVEGQLVVFP